MKYYAVKKGRTPGIYTSWDECRKQTERFPNAVFKSFTSKEQALAYMGSSLTKQQQEPETSDNEQIDKQIASLKLDEVLAFVDGSYLASRKKGGYGALIFEKGKASPVAIEKTLDETQIGETRNFGAEMLGAMAVIDWAISHKKSHLILYYDYAGIEEFATHSWQPKNGIAKAYAAFVDQCKDQIHISFRKVAAHQGVRYNEMVDQLAKKAAASEGKADGKALV